MASPKRTKSERERDLACIAELLLKGWTHEQIAKAIGRTFYSEKAASMGLTPETFLTRRMIGKDCELIEARFRDKVFDDIARLKGLQLAELGLIKKKAWKAWEESIGKVETVTVKTGGKEGKGQETTVKTEVKSGDPRHLHSVLQAIEKQCRLMGLDAPLKLSMDEIDHLIENLLGAAQGLEEVAHGGKAAPDAAAPGEGQGKGPGLTVH